MYDAQEWAVAFKFTTINVKAGVTVTFTNHPSAAPVVWLATGDVTIGGTVQLDGTPGGDASDPSAYAEPGPGGFAGGRRQSTAALLASDGFGPRGESLAGSSGCGGSYGTVGGGSGAGLTYGNPSVLPLIGGSGGGGSNSSSTLGYGGGAGGGAILIASSGDIVTTFTASTGYIRACGGAAMGHRTPRATSRWQTLLATGKSTRSISTRL